MTRSGPSGDALRVSRVIRESRPGSWASPTTSALKRSKEAAVARRMRNRCEMASKGRMSPGLKATTVNGSERRSYNWPRSNEPCSSFSIASVTPARRLRRWSIAQPTQSRRACITDVARCADCYRVSQASRPVDCAAPIAGLHHPHMNAERGELVIERLAETFDSCFAGGIRRRKWQSVGEPDFRLLGGYFLV